MRGENSAILPRGGSARVSNVPAYRYSICAAFLETQILLTVSFLPQFTVRLLDLDLLNRLLLSLSTTFVIREA